MTNLKKKENQLFLDYTLSGRRKPWNLKKENEFVVRKIFGDLRL